MKKLNTNVTDFASLKFAGFKTIQVCGAVFLLLILSMATGCDEATAMQRVANQAPPATTQEPGTRNPQGEIKPGSLNETAKSKTRGPKLESITLGAGCFWCTEAVFQRLEGVEKVTSGYCNGEWPNPTYDDICTGRSGHAEVCKVEYDPEKISLPEILEVFWKTHDPTTLNKQGVDEGTQYRSGIYFTTKEQQLIAERYKKKLTDSGAWGGNIVTEIVPAEKFYPAEDYHQDYFNGVARAAQQGKKKGNFGYCVRIIVPKLQKFESVFADKLKSTAEAKRAEERTNGTNGAKGAKQSPPANGDSPRANGNDATGGSSTQDDDRSNSEPDKGSTNDK